MKNQSLLRNTDTYTVEDCLFEGLFSVTLAVRLDARSRNTIVLGKSINNYKKLFSRESKLDIAEREGFLQPIFDIISDMIVKWRDGQN